MITTTDRIDQVVEQETDALIDAECDGPFQLVGRDEGFKYDANSWHSDCAEYLVGTVDQMDDMRMYLRDALYWIREGMTMTTEQKVRSARQLSILSTQIGWQVLKVALASPLTEEMLGERTE